MPTTISVKRETGQTVQASDKRMIGLVDNLKVDFFNAVYLVKK